MKTPSLSPWCALALVFALLLTGCVSSRYQAAKNDVPLPHALNVAFAPSPLGATLNSVISINGPGSWKRDAYWDEYVVTLHNPGHQPLTVSVVALADAAGAVLTAGSEPWELEKASKTREQQRHETRADVIRYTAPGVLLLAVGAELGSAASMSTGVAVGAAVCIAGVPVYYASVQSINHHNKSAMEKEFQRRRFVLPLTLAPGESRTGSFFFTMVPSPSSLSLGWSSGSDSGEAVLSLGFLHALHTPGTPAATAR